MGFADIYGFGQQAGATAAQVVNAVPGTGWASFNAGLNNFANAAGNTLRAATNLGVTGVSGYNRVQQQRLRYTGPVGNPRERLPYYRPPSQYDSAGILGNPNTKTLLVVGAVALGVILLARR